MLVRHAMAVRPVTDRDLVLRVIVERKDPRSVRLSDVTTTRGIVTASPDTQLCDARALMAQKGIRRLPVAKEAAISASAATEEMDPGPKVGTPDRVKSRREA